MAIFQRLSKRNDRGLSDMGYRVLFLANSMNLSVKNEQLIVDNGQITKIPLEDIECIAVDSPQVVFNSYLLSKLSEYAITLYATDKSHHPCGVYLPAFCHSRHLSVIRQQLDMTLPAKKRLWKQIVVRKIENQALALKFSDIDEWTEVDDIKRKVLSGDSTNMEAVAASRYFRLMFGKSFARCEDNTINACLNYGYAVLRSTIEKYLVVYGYEPCLGLFHKSTLNNFNLADDIIEAFRPAVDLFVRNNVKDDDSFSVAIRARLVNLLCTDILIDGKLYTVAKAIELTVQSMTGFHNGKRTDLLLPELVKTQQHSYE